jgi:hypothetical protein
MPPIGEWFKSSIERLQTLTCKLKTKFTHHD